MTTNTTSTKTMKTTSKPILAAAFAVALAAPGAAFGQGCVPSRGAGSLLHPSIMSCDFTGGTTSHTTMSADGKRTVTPMTVEESRFRASVGYRFFQSDRHYVGNNEQKHRDEEGSSVVNKSNFIDFTLDYKVTDRFSLALTIPFSWHERSSSVRDANDKVVDRYTTKSGGLGDIRLVGYTWLADPKTHRQANVSLGLGVDIPTGEYDQTDTFHRRKAGTFKTIEKFTRAVDQSVQPGDGGWAIILDLYSYYRLNERTTLFAQGTYNITPENDNGVLTGRRNSFEQVTGIPDTYSVRAGVDYAIAPAYGLSAGLAWRMEGAAVYDLIGDEAFRRPGFTMAIEPSLSWVYKEWTTSVSVPVTFYVNRQRSVADELETEKTGTWQHGDSAFADWSVLAGVSRTF